MRRDNAPFILALLLTALGAAGMAMVSQYSEGLLLAAAGVGLAMAHGHRREIADIAHELRYAATRFTAGKSVATQTAAAASEIANACNILIASAAQSITEASVRAKELEIRLKLAEAERQHAESVIYSISDAVLVTDTFDELILANDSAARTFEFDLRTSRRSPVQQLLHDPKIIEMIRETRQATGRAGKRIVEHQLVTPDGNKAFKITLSSVPAPAEDQPPVGVVAVMHDVTREKAVAEMKNDFVSSVSHELRTPLASIKAYVELLIDGEASDEKTKRDFYEVIQNEANRLSRLIDNILSISGIESGLVKVNRQPQSMTVVAKDAIEVITPQAAGKQIQIAEKLTPVLYQTSGDRDMLYQAVLNLLSNAVKYTPEGGRITVETDVDEAQRQKVVVRVRDSGVGIPPKDLPFVFDKFYRVEANKRMAKGTGLGLSLVKHIVETVHQGRVLVESEVGKGSCFGFELDLCE